MTLSGFDSVCFLMLCTLTGWQSVSGLQLLKVSKVKGGCNGSRSSLSLLRYELGKVLGAGSFGIVREAIGKRTGIHYACKTIPKVPKRGKGTPRYLLKLQTEVDAMVQLGPSLDAVYLKVSASSIIPQFVALLSI